MGYIAHRISLIRIFPDPMNTSHSQIDWCKQME